MNKRILIVPGMLIALTTAAFAQSATSGAGEPAMSNQQSEQNGGMNGPGTTPMSRTDQDQAQQSQQAPKRLARNHAKKTTKDSSSTGATDNPTGSSNTMGSSNGTMDSGANSSSSPAPPQ
jgi:hypothetical protein